MCGRTLSEIWIRRQLPVRLTSGLVSVLVLLSSAAWAQGPRYIKDRFIVTFKAEAGDPVQTSEQLARAHGFQVRNVYRYALQGMLFDLPAPAQQHVLDALRQNPNVDSIMPDRTITLTAQTSPKGVVRIGAEGSHARANTGAGVRVAVMDSGIDFEHSDLLISERSLSRQCLPSCVNGGDDAYGHGTSVAGVIAARSNDSDLVGVAPDASLISVRVFDSQGNSSAGAVLAGIDYLRGLNLSGSPVHIVNMSFRELCQDAGGANIPCESDPDMVVLHTAIQNLVASGTTVIAASGNDSTDTAYVAPAGFSETIAVSALADSNGQPGGGGPSVCMLYFFSLCLQYAQDDNFALFSNSGSRVDVIAPGADELLLQNGGGTRRASGTSFAAPHAAGVAAIFIRNRLDRGLPISPATVKQALVTTGECYESGTGAGDLFRGDVGCPQVWPGDRDTFAEPLVRADNVVSFVGDGSVPSAPSSLVATAMSSSQIDLSWTDNSGNEAGFEIARCQGAACSNFAPIATVGANVTTYSDTGLLASTAYSYVVLAYNTAGDSAYSATASATTQSAPQPPAAPTSLTATSISSSQINLAWADSSTDESGFKIERCQGASCTNFAQITTVGANVTAYSNTGLPASTTYRYRVRAYNTAGDSAYSPVASATTQSALQPPTAPSNLTATSISSSQINLAWADSSTDESGFKIERCKGSTCTTFTQIATVGANVNTYSNTGLSRNTTYRYRVRAYNNAGNSSYSNIATAKTLR